jgi:hypothetical protein
MFRNLIESSSLETRIQILKDNAERIENISYLKQLNDEDLALLKTELAVDSIQLAKLDEAKKEFLVDHKAKVKPLKQQLAIALHKIRTKCEEQEAEAFLVANQEEGIMEYFSAEGELIHSRELTQEEKQLRIPTTLNN